MCICHCKRSLTVAWVRHPAAPRGCSHRVCRHTDNPVRCALYTHGVSDREVCVQYLFPPADLLARLCVETSPASVGLRLVSSSSWTHTRARTNSNSDPDSDSDDRERVYSGQGGLGNWYLVEHHLCHLVLGVLHHLNSGTPHKQNPVSIVLYIRCNWPSKPIKRYRLEIAFQSLAFACQATHRCRPRASLQRFCISCSWARNCHSEKRRFSI
jgi:hypothetical protein